MPIDADLLAWLDASPPQTLEIVNAMLREAKDKWTLPTEEEALEDPDTARRYFEGLRWPQGRVLCPFCGSDNIGKFVVTSQTYGCRSCPARPRFSVRTGTAFEGSQLPLHRWFQCLRLYLDADHRSFVASRYSQAEIVSVRTAYHIHERIEERCADIAGVGKPLWTAVCAMLPPRDAEALAG